MGCDMQHICEAFAATARPTAQAAAVLSSSEPEGCPTHADTVLRGLKAKAGTSMYIWY